MGISCRTSVFSEDQEVRSLVVNKEIIITNLYLFKLEDLHINKEKNIYVYKTTVNNAISNARSSLEEMVSSFNRDLLDEWSIFFVLSELKEIRRLISRLSAYNSEDVVVTHFRPILATVSLDRQKAFQEVEKHKKFTMEVIKGEHNNRYFNFKEENQVLEFKNNLPELFSRLDCVEEIENMHTIEPSLKIIHSARYIAVIVNLVIKEEYLNDVNAHRSFNSKNALSSQISQFLFKQRIGCRRTFLVNIDEPNVFQFELMYKLT